MTTDTGCCADLSRIGSVRPLGSCRSGSFRPRRLDPHALEYAVRGSVLGLATLTTGFLVPIGLAQPAQAASPLKISVSPNPVVINRAAKTRIAIKVTTTDDSTPTSVSVALGDGSAS